MREWARFGSDPLAKCWFGVTGICACIVRRVLARAAAGARYAKGRRRCRTMSVYAARGGVAGPAQSAQCCAGQPAMSLTAALPRSARSRRRFFFFQRAVRRRGRKRRQGSVPANQRGMRTAGANCCSQAQRQVARAGTAARRAMLITAEVTRASSAAAR